MLDSAGYIHDDSFRLRERLQRLSSEVSGVEAEASIAEGLSQGLEGPASAANAAAQELYGRITSYESLIALVELGYALWEKFPFEHAVDAMGEWLSWSTLSVKIGGDFVIGIPTTQIRLPVNVLAAYSEAVNSALFDKYIIATSFDTPPSDALVADGPFTHYLFGTIDGGSIESEALFFIDQWRQSSWNSCD
jgi:hypothetical protein